MKKIDIIIPTRNRWKKLLNCLRSIKGGAGFEFEVTVVCDGDKETAERLLELNDDLRPDKVIFVKNHMGSVYCRNLATQTVGDGLICAVDDIVFIEDAIAKAFWAMREHFPDDDGVIGFDRADRDHTKMKVTTGCYGGLALVGHKFLLRYPEKMLYFPDYFLFASQEMTNLAVLLNKIKMEPTAKIYHYAPRKGGGMDQTHRDGRKWRLRDKALRRSRSENGLLWGT